VIRYQGKKEQGNPLKMLSSKCSLQLVEILECHSLRDYYNRKYLKDLFKLRTMKDLDLHRFMIHLSIQSSNKLGLELEREELENIQAYQRYHPTSLNKTHTQYLK